MTGALVISRAIPRSYNVKQMFYSINHTKYPQMVLERALGGGMAARIE